jgi:hypothetical protein
VGYDCVVVGYQQGVEKEFLSATQFNLTGRRLDAGACECRDTITTFSRPISILEKRILSLGAQSRRAKDHVMSDRI